MNAVADPAYEAYMDFLRAKVKLSESWGFDCDDSEIHPMLKPHQRAAVRWNVEGGRRADFLAFGLGKTFVQLETVRIVRSKAGGLALIVLPLGVRLEFARDAAKLGIKVKFIRRADEIEDDETIYLTNYQTIRDGKLDPALFTVASLDEASCLRGFGGTKTFREFMALFTGDAGPGRERNGTSRVPYRFVATATPSPNDYIELLAYAAFLGIMDVSQAKTRFFKRDSTKADKLTLHKHKEKEFWLWVASWALFIQKPSDLGFSDEGYDLPELDIRWHEVPTDHSTAAPEMSGQGRLFRDSNLGVQEAAAEKRDSLPARLAKLLEIRAEDPAAHRILWHDLEREREALERSIPGLVSVYGSQAEADQEGAIIGFSDGLVPELAGKPCMLGSGCNFQRHCAWAIYLGIGFKFNDLIQSIHRLRRFLQTRRVRIDLIYTEAERGIRKETERKWKQHNTMVQQMADIIKEHGLSLASMAQTLSRKMGVERVVVSGPGYDLYNNDNVLELRGMRSNSIGFGLTSIPFSTQYEYSPNYADYGHSEGNEEFFRQMDFSTPEVLRVLMPGRIAAVHVKDRIVPGGMTGLGFQTVYPFHVETIHHFVKHGFAYMGMITIVTDVVRENAQTYRLGHTEVCKDSTKMGVGMPEYLLLFRKPPSSTEKSYADLPVRHLSGREQLCKGCRKIFPAPKRKQKPHERCPECNGEMTRTKHDNEHGPKCYTRTRWQIDAHAFHRSNGDRHLTPEELKGLTHKEIFRLFRGHDLSSIYELEHHVKVGEALELAGKLPTDFMLLQPQSQSDEVWTDITRMLTLNNAQSAAGRENHLCPMQFDIADRAIERWSNPGDTVLDWFGGLMTVPFRAIKKGRKGVGIELSAPYFLDGASYCAAAAAELNTPSLFDLMGGEEAEDDGEGVAA
ncbi:DNA methyltransferase [Luteolibacter arcticus]|uniref:DNA methyltransferase n=1 Tax=Luteolibacter arcticus TaxID=1581411 RepID=A0ABT3GGF6_9BACT|nr:DNA methyltransferase [Luteolibacter arcticus]MCW1922696.1 DNA methyltransferase [Luteolibacter arcticus]